MSVDVTARTDDTFPPSLINTTRYDRHALAEASDYLALMAYDEYNRYRPSGPTASQQWTEDALHWLLRYADPHQILLGVPFYSRIWDPEDLGKPTTATDRNRRRARRVEPPHLRSPVRYRPGRPRGRPLPVGRGLREPGHPDRVRPPIRPRRHRRLAPRLRHARSVGDR